jgi:diamine N-acetyltransferase
MQYTIRWGKEADFDQVYALIKELALFEKAPEKVINSPKQMREEKELFKLLVAEKEDGEIIGFALFYFVYYTWVGKSLYLDDLYVKEKYRGHKIGSQLLDKVLDYGKQNKVKRIRWQVLEWNKPAIEFYKKLGAVLDNEWINCDIENI